MVRLPADVGSFPDLLLDLRSISSDARFSVAQPVAICGCGPAPIRWAQARVCFRSSTPGALEDRQYAGRHCECFGYRVVRFHDLYRRALVAGFERRATG